jgi:adenine-specific DNA-methyltransferase
MKYNLLNDSNTDFSSEKELIFAALSLGAEQIQPWSQLEKNIALQAASAIPLEARKIASLKEQILAGFDPLGEIFCNLRAPSERRNLGATYTPDAIVANMVEWSASYKNPMRIIDPGAGSARFLVKAGHQFPVSTLIGIEIDPLAALIARANLAVHGFAVRARVVLEDYRRFNEQISGNTLYIGNPPYVRHHQISMQWKNWFSHEAEKLGYKASKLAGLHVHFFLTTALRAKAGDFGTFITASEWLDVNYGSLVRSLLLEKLGGQSITLIEPTARPFPDAATTAVISTFEIQTKPTSLYFRRVDDLANLESSECGKKVSRERLKAHSRWSPLTRTAEEIPDGYIELGEICRVHRGQVTGANNVWIAGAHSSGLPENVLYRTVTRAREVIEAGGLLKDTTILKSVIDLPADLDAFDKAERSLIEKFLRIAKNMGAHLGYTAKNRKVWWSIGLKQPAPIIATYMARRAPAFAINEADARLINIAHGLYPREDLNPEVKVNLVRYLQSNVSQASGRTYAGGLTKFEPGEMERLIVPNLDMLASGAFL